MLVALVPGRLDQFLYFGLQKFVEDLLYAAVHKFLELTLDYILI